MDAIHGKVGLPNFVLTQPGHVRQHQDTIDRFAESPALAVINASTEKEKAAPTSDT